MSTAENAAIMNEAPRAPFGSSWGVLSDRFCFVPLIWLYVFMVQFGLLVRFTEEETSRGFTTIIVVALVVLGLLRWVRAFLSEPIYWAFGLLLLYALFPTSLARTPGEAFGFLVELTGYILLSAVVSRTELNTSRLRVYWFAIAAGLLLSSALTIIDFAGIADVPRNNEVRLETRLGSYSVEQASGFFARRSAMASVFSLGIAGSIILALGVRSLSARLFFLGSGALGMICLVLTHNRSGVLAAVMTIAAYSLFSRRLAGFKRLAVIPIVVLLGSAGIMVFAYFFPETAEIYLAKLGFIGLADFVWESDYHRLETLYRALESLVERPIGNGFTLIPLPGGLEYQAHNVIVSIVWALGIFSLVWLPGFAVTLYRRLRLPSGIRSTVEEEAVKWALLAWLINGMAHSQFFAGIAWIMFGAAIACQNQRVKEAAAASREPELGLEPAAAGVGQLAAPQDTTGP